MAISTCMGSNLLVAYPHQADMQHVDTKVNSCVEPGAVVNTRCAWCSVVSGAGAVQWAGGGYSCQSQEPAKGFEGTGIQFCHMPYLLPFTSQSRMVVSCSPCCCGCLTVLLLRGGLTTHAAEAKSVCCRWPTFDVKAAAYMCAEYLLREAAESHSLNWKIVVYVVEYV